MQNEHTIAYALASAVEPHTIFVSTKLGAIDAAHQIKNQSPATPNDIVALAVAWVFGDNVPASTLELDAMMNDNASSMMLDMLAELA